MLKQICSFEDYSVPFVSSSGKDIKKSRGCYEVPGHFREGNAKDREQKVCIRG